MCIRDRYITKGLLKISKEVGIEITQSNFTCLPNFNIISNQKKELVDTLFIQEMLKRGYLASTSIYPSYCHTSEIIDEYFTHVKEVFTLIKSANEDNKISDLLETEPRSDSFKRLT